MMSRTGPGGRRVRVTGQCPECGRWGIKVRVDGKVGWHSPESRGSSTACPGSGTSMAVTR